ncbi:MAG: hypothetical protein ACK4N5_18780, partial [Myxococcales bacterium]
LPEPARPARGRPGARRNVRPFEFKNLEKIPYRHLLLMQRLEWLLPRVVLSTDLGDTVRDRLHALFDEDVRLWVDYVHLVGAKSVRKLVPDNTFLGVVTTSAHGPRGLIEIELGFAHSIVDLLLGAAASDAVLMRPLTEIEQGVLSYMVLESFKAISPTPEPGRPRLRLERVADSTEDALKVFEEEKTVALVEFKALIGNSAGYIRMLLPGSLVHTALPPEDGEARRSRRVAQIQKRLPWLKSVKSWLRAEIGGTELTGADLRGLRSGDVLLLDALTTPCHRGENGSATLRVGLGRSGHARAAVELVDGSYQAKVEALVIEAEGYTPVPDDDAQMALSEPIGDGFPDDLLRDEEELPPEED